MNSGEGFAKKVMQKQELAANDNEPVAEGVKNQAETVEAGKPVESGEGNVFSRGEERFQKAGAYLSDLKSKAGAFFAKIPQVASAWSRKAAVGVLSTPELIGAAKESVNDKLDSAALWGTNKAEEIAEFGRTKKEQFGNYLNQKAESVKAVGELASNWSAEKAAQAREKIDSGITTVTEWGARSLASAEARRVSVMNSFREKVIEAKFQRLARAEEEAFAVRQEAEARHQAILQKLALMQKV